MRNKTVSKGKYIHFDTLVSAKTGDIVAIQDILNQFRGYIISRSALCERLTDRTAHSTNILTPMFSTKWKPT